MLHSFLFGFFLGCGAAIPIGPMNIEIMRRNLTLGARFGVLFGLGACAADLTYMILLSFGLLVLFSTPFVMSSVTILGALLLLYFAFNILRAPINSFEVKAYQASHFALKHFFSGYSLTLINPATIIFWLSVSAQITAQTAMSHRLLWASLGVIMGTVGWALSFNLFLNFTRHKISPLLMRLLNIFGAMLLIGFAIYGLLKIFLFNS